MHIGETLRVLTVEPIVSPVPDGDFPGRDAEAHAVPPHPGPRRGAAVPSREPEVVPVTAGP